MRKDVLTSNSIEKIILICLMAVLTAACAAKPIPIPVSSTLQDAVTSTAAPVEPTHAPEQFEKNIPSSEIMLQALVTFDKTYARVYSDNSVNDAVAGVKIAAVLKESELGFTMQSCPTLSLSNNFDRVHIAGYNVTLSNPQKIEIYSAYDCVHFSTLNRTLRGEVRLLGDKILEWEGTKATLRNAAGGKTLYDGDLGKQISTGGMIGGKIVLILRDGLIMGYNNEMSAFTLDGTFPVAFSLLNYAADTFYGTTAQDGYFFTLNDNAGETFPYKECSLSINSPYAICGGTLIGSGVRYHDIPASTRFSAGAGLLLDLKDGNLNIFSLESSWQRYVSFDYTLPDPCVGEDGAVYFNSFSGVASAIKGGREIQSPRPQKCDDKSVELNGGIFLCGGKECGVFAETVNTDGKTRILRRIEGGKWRYYFD